MGQLSVDNDATFLGDMDMMHNASWGACCDYPELVTKYYPTLACRNCDLIWDEGIPKPKPQKKALRAAASLSQRA
jgi:hypothetical protein